MDFDYFYNREVEGFNFLKVPEILVEGEEFQGMSAEEIMKKRHLSKPTAIKLLDELDKRNGIGLIERVRVGLGKPNIIYVKDFLSMVQEKSVVQKFKDLTSEVKNIDLRSKGNELQDVKSLNPNYIDRSNSNNRKRALPIYEIRITRPQEL